ncbi:Cmx/CmrA family chloramphenicol efflux MFS transporter [Agromyces subbeticus]|uniref:Cmx/CmrA family chloramphenicol efflux MFS transporter n=1 Tax=Agromyces subbeticus TaxID=293890 RepID=UPI0003B352AA|nr:Cmx/CmrA family chloramphenicol efflux MFS transporter [Agromyces subbeticus]
MPPIVILLAIAVFAQGTSEFMLAGLLPGIATDLSVSIPQAGLLTSAFAAGMVVGAPLMAALSRRWSPRVALTGFLLVFIAMHVIGALTDSFTVLFSTRIIAALTNAGFLAVTLSTVSTLVPADRMSRALSVILGGTTLALIAGVPAGAAAGALLDWRAALWGVALISVPALVAVALWAPNRSASGPAASAASLRSELRVLRRRSLQLPLALGALVNAATFCAFTYLAAIVIEATRLDAGVMPFVLAVFGLGAFVGVWTAGRFGDRFGSRIVSLGSALLLTGWVTLAVVSTQPVALFVLAFAQGALSFAVGSTLIAIALRAADGAPTMSGSYATASLNVGAAIGPIVGGLAYATVLGPTGPLVVSAALVLIAIVLAVLGARFSATPR